VTYTPDDSLDEACYREAQSCDIYVLILGGRYGSEVSDENRQIADDFFAHYESVTKREYETAVDRDIPIYILIERSVYTEYRTFQKNRDNTSIKYAFVENVNVFRFLDEILAQKKNNPYQQFERSSEIEEWLRRQWAGLFRELLQRRSSQQQLATLTAEVSALRELNKTLRLYLEQVLHKVDVKDADQLISRESKRLEASETWADLKGLNGFVRWLESKGLSRQQILEILTKPSTWDEVIDLADSYLQERPDVRDQILRKLQNEIAGSIAEDYNQLRAYLDLPSVRPPSGSLDFGFEAIQVKRRATRKPKAGTAPDEVTS